MKMKKQLKTAGIIILAVVLMLLLGVNSWRISAPTAALVAPLAGLVAVSMTIGLGTVSGVATALVGGLGLLLLASADWPLVLNFLVLALLVGWLIGWHIPLGQRVTQQQLIWLGIVAGISEFILNLVQVALVGALTGAGWLIFIRLALPQCTNGAPVCRFGGPPGNVLALAWPTGPAAGRAGRRFRKFATGLGGN